MLSIYLKFNKKRPVFCNFSLLFERFSLFLQSKQSKNIGLGKDGCNIAPQLGQNGFVRIKTLQKLLILNNKD